MSQAKAVKDTSPKLEREVRSGKTSLNDAYKRIPRCSEDRRHRGASIAAGFPGCRHGDVDGAIGPIGMGRSTMVSHLDETLFTV